jgi:hypothetical protein
MVLALAVRLYTSRHLPSNHKNNSRYSIQAKIRNKISKEESLVFTAELPSSLVRTELNLSCSYTEETNFMKQVSSTQFLADKHRQATLFQSTLRLQERSFRSSGDDQTDRKGEKHITEHIT